MEVFSFAVVLKVRGARVKLLWYVMIDFVMETMLLIRVYVYRWSYFY